MAEGSHNSNRCIFHCGACFIAVDVLLQCILQWGAYFSGVHISLRCMQTSIPGPHISFNFDVGFTDQKIYRCKSTGNEFGCMLYCGTCKKNTGTPNFQFKSFCKKKWYLVITLYICFPLKMNCSKWFLVILEIYPLFNHLTHHIIFLNHYFKHSRVEDHRF